MDIVRERYDMAISRINEIAGESLIKEPYGDYFTADYFLIYVV